MAGLTPLERDIIIGFTTLTMVSCAAPMTPVSPSGSKLPPDLQLTAQAIDASVACLELQPSLEVCTSPVDYEIIKKTRIDVMASALSKSDISPQSKKMMTDTLTKVTDLQKEGKIQWFLFRNRIVYGRVRAYKGTSFSVKVILSQVDLFREATALGSDLQELRHVVQLHDAFIKTGYLSEKEDIPELEYNAYFYDYLMEAILRREGYSSNKKEILEMYGIDMVEVVYMLDKNNQGSDSALYRYLFDLEDRFMAKKDSDQTTVKKIDEKWKGFPVSETAEFNMLEIIKTQKDWFDPNFFPKQPQGRWGGSGLVDHRYHPDNKMYGFAQQGVVFAGTTKGVPYPKFVTRALGRRA